jgi:thiamine pyrophosphate-dependent acetolactate synthase large subunit-like protein
VPEVENGMVDPWFYMGNPNVVPILIPDSLENKEFSLNYSISHICKECLNKYSDRIKKEMNTFWYSYWEKKKSDNKERFAKYEDDKKSQEVKELEEKIKQLEQEKLYIIHPELRPEPTLVIIGAWLQKTTTVFDSTFIIRKSDTLGYKILKK